MAVGSGLCAQFGIAAESTAGTPVTVTRFHEITSVKPKHDKNVVVAEGLRACAKVRAERDSVVTSRAAEIEFEAPILSKSFGLLLQHMLGGNVTPVLVGAGPLNRQTHLLGDLTGRSLTAQGGFPESYGAATVRPFTYNGCKIPKWELECKAQELLTIKATLDAWNWTTATALAAAVFPTASELFHWANLQILIGGTPTTASGRTTIASSVALKGAMGASIKGANNLANERFLAGGSGLKSEQIENGFREFGGDIELEFADRTQVSDLFDSHASTALEFRWTGSLDVGSAQFASLSVLFPKAKFLSGFPEIDGPDIVSAKAEFVAMTDDAGTHPPIQIEYTSVDATL